MRILVVTNMYAGSNLNSVSQGIFVTEQVEALRCLYGDTIDVFIIKGHASRIDYFKSLFRVLSLVRRNSYDVVHYHFGLSACSAPFVRCFTDSRIVITFHGSDVLGNRWMRRSSLLFARFAHACIAVSEEIKATLQVASKLIVTIPCAVNERLFAGPIGVDSTSRRTKIVVFPSSPLRAEKDYPLFQQTVALLAGKWKLEVNERHIDGLNRIEVRDLLAQADCLIMTSKREGSPQSVKEAMASNLPVVSVDVGDVRDLLFGVSQSYVVEDRSPEKLAGVIAAILTEGQRSNGRQRLSDLGLLSENVAIKIANLYESISENRLDISGSYRGSDSVGPGKTEIM